MLSLDASGTHVRRLLVAASDYPKRFKKPPVEEIANAQRQQRIESVVEAKMAFADPIQVITHAAKAYQACFENCLEYGLQQYWTRVSFGSSTKIKKSIAQITVLMRK